MKKYVVFILAAVVIVLAYSASAFADLTISGEFVSKKVGEEYRNYFEDGEVTTGYDGVKWSIIDGALPPGLRLVEDGLGEAHLEGTPTTAGTYTFTLQASIRWLSTGETETGTKTFTITIMPASDGGSNNNNSNNGISPNNGSGGGGGGCDSGMSGLCLAVLAVFTLTRRK